MEHENEKANLLAFQISRIKKSNHVRRRGTRSQGQDRIHDQSRPLLAYPVPEVGAVGPAGAGIGGMLFLLLLLRPRDGPLRRGGGAGGDRGSYSGFQGLEAGQGGHQNRQVLVGIAGCFRQTLVGTFSMSILRIAVP